MRPIIGTITMATTIIITGAITITMATTIITMGIITTITTNVDGVMPGGTPTA